MKKMLALVFQEYGLKTVVLLSLKEHGPSSMNKPTVDEHPGPISQSVEVRKSEGKNDTAISPEDYVVLVGVISTLKEVEEKVSSFNVYVACIRAG
jgi:hypothetical protein